MRTRLIGIATSLALVVTACGGSDGDSESESGDSSEASTESDDSSDSGETAAPAGGASTYAAELEDGTTLTVRFDVAETDPVIAPFAEFRQEAGVADPVVWLVGSLEVPADYDDTTGPATGRFLTFVPAGGQVISESNITSTFACGQLDDWFGAPTGDEANALNESYIGVVNGACNGQTFGVPAESGGTTDYAMIVEGSTIPDFESVFAGLLTELEPVG